MESLAVFNTSGHSGLLLLWLMLQFIVVGVVLLLWTLVGVITQRDAIAKDTRFKDASSMVSSSMDCGYTSLCPQQGNITINKGLGRYGYQLTNEGAILTVGYVKDGSLKAPRPFHVRPISRQHRVEHSLRTTVLRAEARKMLPRFFY